MPQDLHINIDRRQQEVRHAGVNHIRILVGVLINLVHQHSQISNLFREKISGYVANLTASNLAPHDMLFGCQNYW